MKRVAVVDNESATKPGGHCTVLKRFGTVKEAETWIAALPDAAKVARGGYGIDAPEEMINGTEGR
jgi:delta-aminolevulinic acid dehydratase/porphobilinogen synthase